MKSLKSDNRKIAPKLAAKTQGRYNWDHGAIAFDKKEKWRGGGRSNEQFKKDL